MFFFYILGNDICKIVDVIMNPNVVKNVKKDAGLQEFLTELLRSYLFEKYKVEIVGSKLFSFTNNPLPIS